MDDEELRQVEQPCPNANCPVPGGSMYRRGDVCNRCGCYAPPAPTARRSFHQGKPPRGQLWDSKEHRYKGMAT